MPATDMPATDNNYNESDVDESDIDIDDSDSSTNWPALIGFLIFIAVCVCCVQPWVSMKIAQRTFKDHRWTVSKEVTHGGWTKFRKWTKSTLAWHLCCPCMVCWDWNSDFPTTT